MSLYGASGSHLPRWLVSRVYSLPPLTRLVRAGLGLLLPSDLGEARIMGGWLAGKRILIYPRNEVSFVSGLWEFWVEEALRANLRPGDVAWDVGAYIGYFTLMMRDLCEPGHVTALEPDPANRERLQQVLALNGVDDVHVLPVAAGAQDGVTRLRQFSGHPAASVAGQGELDVPLVTLDALYPEYGTPRLIKLDVEGAEADVLRGASRLLDDARPVWLIELHGEGGREAVEILQAAGYTVKTLNQQETATHQPHVLAIPLAREGRRMARDSRAENFPHKEGTEGDGR